MSYINISYIHRNGITTFPSTPWAPGAPRTNAITAWGKASSWQKALEEVRTPHRGQRRAKSREVSGMGRW